MSAKREKIARVIRIVWDSLDSHIDPAVKADSAPCETCGSRYFHAKTAREYAEAIKLLTELL